MINYRYVKNSIDKYYFSPMREIHKTPSGCRYYNNFAPLLSLKSANPFSKAQLKPPWLKDNETTPESWQLARGQEHSQSYPRGRRQTHYGWRRTPQLS